MKCREYRSALLEFARGGPMEDGLAAHLENCPECATVLEHQMVLTGDLRALAAEAPQAPDMEAALRARFVSHHRRKVLRWVPVAIAASLVAGFLLYQRQPEKKQVAVAPPPAAVVEPRPAPTPAAEPAPKPQVAKRTRRRAVKPPEPMPFLPIPYTEPLAPYERAMVMRMEVPVAAVMAAGFRVTARDPGARVTADLLVGEDGRARAIRPLAFSSFPTERSMNR